MNSIAISGRLGADPEIRQVGDSRVTTFRLAETTSRKGQDGSYITNWYRCDAWGKTGETCAKYLHKGDPVTVTGELMIRNYKDKSGQDRTSVEVKIDRFAFGGKSQATAQQTVPAPQESDDDLPF